MTNSMDSLLNFSDNDSHQIDMDAVERMMAFNKRAKWDFPVGLPECVNIKSLAESVIANSGLYSTRKKDRWFAKLIKNPDVADQWFSELPIPQAQSEKLGTKHKLVLAAIMMNGDRISHLKQQVSKQSLKGVPEIFLINRYYKRIHGEALFTDLNSIEERNRDPEREKYDTHPMEMLAFVRCEALHNVSSLFIVKSIIRDVIKQAYEDIFADNENASMAAAAIFAIGSLAECRWFLDFVYQHSPEIFNKHYSTLSFFNPEKVIRKREITGESGTIEDVRAPYEPLDIDLASDQFYRLMKLHSEGLRLPLLEIRISDLAESMSFDIEEPLAVFDNLDELLEDTASCESHIRTVRKEIQELVIHRLPVYMHDHINRLNSVIDRFFAVFDKHEKPDMESVRETLDEFCDELPNAKSPRVAGLLAGIMQVDQLVDSAELNVSEMLGEHEALTEEIRKLSQDPVKNRDRLQEALGELTQMDEAVGESLEYINDSINALKNTLEMAKFKLLEVQEEDGEGKTSENESAESARDESYEELLEISESENRKLAKEIVDLKAQNENLTSALAKQRSNDSENGLSDALREIMQKRYIHNEKLTVEECLMLTKAMYPDTVVLPSAWSSAADYTHFEYTDKLCDCLLTLSGEYLKQVKNSTPDAEARKLFPNKVFAANESQTVSSGALRKEREFMYQGQKHFFDKHLRLGVASDVRKTIRVHFDVIDGQMVIAFCGEHKRV